MQITNNDMDHKSLWLAFYCFLLEVLFDAFSDLERRNTFI